MPSFDVVSKVDWQEVRNAVNQVEKEVATRYDLKNANCKIELDEKLFKIILSSPDELNLGSVRELLSQRLAKRGVSLKSVKYEEPIKAGGDVLKQDVVIKQGLCADELKRLTKVVKESKIKVTPSIQADQLRISGKKRDDLQSTIVTLKASASDLNLQFVNFRE